MKHQLSLDSSFSKNCPDTYRRERRTQNDSITSFRPLLLTRYKASMKNPETLQSIDFQQNKISLLR